MKKHLVKSLREVPVVCVEWNDTTSFDEWMPYARARHLAFARRRTVGHLLARNRRGDLTIAGLLGPDDGPDSQVG